MSKNVIDINDMLFGAPAITSAEQANPPADPTLPTRIPVTLDNLVPYWGNPRTSQNPAFNEIKESIRNRGLDHAPNVTRRSPNEKYMIKDGGNTRLRALQELFAETQDPRFFTIDCLFYPWVSDRDQLIAHIIENEMRGSMTFIDRARAAMRIKADLEAEAGEVFSIQKLANDITSLGWTLQRQTLYSMVYAHDVLLPYLPASLDTGLGRPSIAAIRKFLTALESYWHDKGQADFEQVWGPVFQRLDGEGFDADWARDETESAMANRLGIAVHSLRAEMQVREGRQQVDSTLITPGINTIRPLQTLPKTPATKTRADSITPPAPDATRPPRSSSESMDGDDTPSRGWDAQSADQQAAGADAPKHHEQTDWVQDIRSLHAQFENEGPQAAGRLVLAAYDDSRQLDTLRYYIAWVAQNCWTNILIPLTAQLGIAEWVAPPQRLATTFHLAPLPTEGPGLDQIAWYFWLSDIASRTIMSVIGTELNTALLEILGGDEHITSDDAIVGHYNRMRDQFYAAGGSDIALDSLKSQWDISREINRLVPQSIETWQLDFMQHVDALQAAITHHAALFFHLSQAGATHGEGGAL
jgi:ParB family protein of integrating conjugative element (PFGI_1 class)